MPAGLGGAGRVGLAFETTMGTWAAPTVWMPILDESLEYNEDKYYSPQIRETTIVSDVKSSFYHVEGDIQVEADSAFLPHLLYASRHTPVKTGAGDPWSYKFTPSQAGSASTAAGAATPKTLSILVVRNGIGFGYAGCVVGGGEFTIDEGVLKFTANILGLSETTQSGAATWVASELFGADAHAVYVAASAVSPTFGAASTDFNGFTFNFNYNAEAQNRIRTDRAASYISYGETEAGYTTELDFIDKAEYDLFKAATTKAIKLESCRPGGAGTFAAATEAVQIQVNRSAYDAYGVNLPGMGDLIMADVTGRAIGIAGGDPYAITVKSGVSIV